MKLAVTGAAGLIGANVVRSALARGHHVAAVVRPGGQRDALVGTKAEIVEADVLGPVEALAAACAGADAIVHTAASFSYGGDSAAINRIAVEGTEAVLRAAQCAGVGRVVVTSSSVVFGYSHDGRVLDESSGLADPKGQPAYVAAKIAQNGAALALAGNLQIDLLLACPTMSLGPTASTLGPSNGIITAYLTDPTRSTFVGGCNIVSAEDVGVGHVLITESGKPRQHYLLGPENLRWRDIHVLLSTLAGIDGPHVELGRTLSWLAASAEEARAMLTGAPPTTTREQAGMVGRYYWYDSTLAAELGYAPRPARMAILEALSWLATSRHLKRETRTSMRLAPEIWQYRFTGAGA